MNLRTLFQFQLMIKFENLSYDSIDPGNQFLDLVSKVIISDSLLIHQFGSDNVMDFLNNLTCILDKKTFKKNTLFILSPPNSGKNYFFDC